MRVYGLSVVQATLAWLAVAQLAGAQRAADTLEARDLAAGVTYRHFIDKATGAAAYLVRVDLRSPSLALRVVRAHDALRSRERPSSMVQRAQETGVNAIVAVNADFFNLQTGENENNQVIDGTWFKGVKNADSPYDSYDTPHVQFGLDATGRPVMDRFMFDGVALAHGTVTPILTLNAHQPGTFEGTTLYTSRFGATTPRDSGRAVVEAPLIYAGQSGDTVRYLRRGALDTTSGNSIPSPSARLVAYGAGLRAEELRAMADGDTVRVVLGTLPRLAAGTTPQLLVGGWPRLLRDGAVVVNEARVPEGTLSRNAELRHPRTALGFSRDSSTLYLLAVDGRSESSGGLTLDELARLMRSLGAWQAMNFDGGGSTTMVVQGAVVNKPSDATGEREVGNVLIVVRLRDE